MKILWGWIIIIGFGFEILAMLLLNVVVIGWLQYMPTSIELSLSLFIGLVLCGLWVAKKAKSKQILHGTLVGAASVLVYLIITVIDALAGKAEIEYDFLYFYFHIVKILGGAIGGLMALKLTKPKITT